MNNKISSLHNWQDSQASDFWQRNKNTRAANLPATCVQISSALSLLFFDLWCHFASLFNKLLKGSHTFLFLKVRVYRLVEEDSHC